MLHGSPTSTGDADVCPEPTPENLDRLAAALARHARSHPDGERPGRLRLLDRSRVPQSDGHGQPRHRLRRLRHLLPSPPDSRATRSSRPHAVDVPIGGVVVQVASLDGRDPLQGDRRSPQGPRYAAGAPEHSRDQSRHGSAARLRTSPRPADGSSAASGSPCRPAHRQDRSDARTLGADPRRDGSVRRREARRVSRLVAADVRTERPRAHRRLHPVLVNGRVDLLAA